jgi:hypothetical protein
MGFSYTLLALSKAYAPDEIDILSADLGVGRFRATYEASVEDAMSMSGGSTEFSLCTLPVGSLFFCNQMDGLMQGFDIRKASERIGKAALIIVEEHSMVMVATYYQDGVLMRDFIENNLEKINDERHDSYRLPTDSDGLNECMAIVKEIVGQSFYAVEPDHEVMQFVWATDEA